MDNKSKKLNLLLRTVLFIILGIIAITFLGLVLGWFNMSSDRTQTLVFSIIVLVPICIIAYYLFKNSKFPTSQKADDEAAFLKEKTYNEMKKKHMF